MRPTLFVLAAGLGSRYGGLKQMDGVGPSGETIIEYSVYDAIQTGFGKVVFVIRHSFDEEFREFVNARFAKDIPVDIVYQEITDLPDGYSPNPEREKPWGTNHAVLMAKHMIREPFCVINADDFYGRTSFEVMSKFLFNVYGKTNQYSMVGFRIQNTLSESGAVARGVSQTDGNGYLTNVVERTHIERLDDGIKYKDANGEWHLIEENTPVSMNIWGFTPDYFQHSEEYFKKFLDEHGHELKSEFFIPLMVNYLIQNRISTVKVLDTDSQWFGVTYREDKPAVIAKINQLVEKNIYPDNLWK
ncbi:MAG: nucleotidyltransferase [Prevotellaceae bacterium]|jgi:UTP-glucose-1-phosphate uridylyltransferase|nr:nucleotidyltransferase [Prevotellaceae bacterium]